MNNNESQNLKHCLTKFDDFKLIDNKLIDESFCDLSNQETFHSIYYPIESSSDMIYYQIENSPLINSIEQNENCSAYQISSNSSNEQCNLPEEYSPIYATVQNYSYCQQYSSIHSTEQNSQSYVIDQCPLVYSNLQTSNQPNDQIESTQLDTVRSQNYYLIQIQAVPSYTVQSNSTQIMNQNVNQESTSQYINLQNSIPFCSVACNDHLANNQSALNCSNEMNYVGYNKNYQNMNYADCDKNYQNMNYIDNKNYINKMNYIDKTNYIGKTNYADSMNYIGKTNYGDSINYIGKTNYGDSINYIGKTNYADSMNKNMNNSMISIGQLINLNEYKENIELILTDEQNVAPNNSTKKVTRSSNVKRTLGENIFPFKLYDIISNSKTDAIKWSTDGYSFEIDFHLFEREHLAKKKFRSSKIKSFIRSLNLYGFSKLKKNENRYFHENFKRGNKEALKQIHRKSN